MRLLVVVLLLVLAAVAYLASRRVPGEESDPDSIFNGRDLTGWDGDPAVWSVRDGAIVGSSEKNPVARNTFLVWQGGEVADFELKVEVRLTGANNSGVQYRSVLGDPWTVGGYQADLHPQPTYLGMLYEEGGRGILALRGERKANGALAGILPQHTSVDLGEWNELTVVARGPRLIHKINGVTTVDVRDESGNDRGVLALQVHAGPPMTVEFRKIRLRALPPAPAPAPPPANLPLWIWAGAPRENQTVRLERRFEARGDVLFAGSCDNVMQVFLNGKQIALHGDWTLPVCLDLTPHVRPGKNVLAIKATNHGGPAGLVGYLRVGETVIPTDATWGATELAKLGAAPWGGSVNAASLTTTLPVDPLAPRTARPQPAPELSTPKGFVAERLFTVPRETMGSWVALTRDDDGRLWASAEGGGIFAIDVGAAETRVRRAPVAVGGAQGLCWAFGSLYATVHGAQNGLHRLKDTDGDGLPDTDELLTTLKSGGEHGAHAIVRVPGEDALLVVAGNHTPLPKEATRSRIPMNWGEDLLLPRLWDAGGHAHGILAPGGWVCRVDPDGKEWEVLCIGMRNPYDIALDPEGELFTFDADMEWDMGLPWYRPTRILHLTSGAEFGWRSGTGKWPAYYADSLPAVLDVGPGSPTGVVFGTGARFPTRYQAALFALDWTYGTIWAVHLEEKGASYTGRKEAFLTGKPLPVTDAVVGKDGALYFVTGGRGTQSHLFRVRYTGDASVEAPRARPVPGVRKLRRRLEAMHGRPGDQELPWSHLDHPDRFVRYAARVALESQPLDRWRERVFGSRPHLHGELALARQGEPADLERLLRREIPWPVRHHVDRLLVELRLYALCFLRLGKPVNAGAIREDLERYYPHPDPRANAELVQLLVYLGSPTVVKETVELMERADPPPIPDWAELIQRNDEYGGTVARMLASPPPADRIHLALALRVAKNGWTPDLRRRYFRFFQEAAQHPGGLSYTGFLEKIRADALASCTPEERAAVADLTRQPLAQTPKIDVKPPQGPGRKWTPADLRPLLLEKRDFKSGKNLYHAVACARCHRFDGVGGNVGPDLSSVASRYSPGEILEAILEPSKVISDQYGSHVVTLKDGTTLTGLVVDRGSYVDFFPPDASATAVRIAKSDIASQAPSDVSQMPTGLADELNRNELLDLLAYLVAGGDKNHAVYR